MTLKRTILPTAVAVAALSFAAVAAAPALAQMKEQTVTVGGAPMYPSKNIIQNAVNSKDHTTLVAAVKAAGLVETLQGPGPVHRVRADQRRVREAAGRHGRHAAQAADEGEAGRGADLSRGARPACRPRTCGRRPTRAAARPSSRPSKAKSSRSSSRAQVLTIRDSKGNASKVTIQNVFQSNGVIHVIDNVLMPS